MPHLLPLATLRRISGIPDEKWKNFKPDPKITHFSAPQGFLFQIADLTFYQEYLQSLKNERVDPSTFSFRLGYFFHLVTDNLWSDYIGRLTFARYKEQFESDCEFIWEVKKDWYSQDFIYVHSHPYSLFWSVFLKSEPDTAGLDFLPLDALSQRVSYIKTFYQRTDEDIQKQMARPMVYLSAAEMDQFVDRATTNIDFVFNRLWQEDLKG